MMSKKKVKKQKTSKNKKHDGKSTKCSQQGVDARPKFDGFITGLAFVAEVFERILIQKARAKNRNAFDTLVESYRKRLYGFFHHHINRDFYSNEDIDDIYQDTGKRRSNYILAMITI